jgi:hypothetical protein
MVDFNLGGCYKGTKVVPPAALHRGAPVAAVIPPCGDVITTGHNTARIGIKLKTNCLQFE